MRRVAILGLGEGCELYPPDWEIWSLAWGHIRHHGHRVFEIHGPDGWKETGLSVDKMNEIDAPIYMRAVHPEILHSVAYPLNDVLRLVQEPMQSSIAYMLGLAILERVDALGLHGVHMRVGEEYAHQRANCRYLLGFARGRGIEVTLPNGCGLYDEKGLYGVAA